MRTEILIFELTKETIGHFWLDAEHWCRSTDSR